MKSITLNFNWKQNRDSRRCFGFKRLDKPLITIDGSTKLGYCILWLTWGRRNDLNKLKPSACFNLWLFWLLERKFLEPEIKVLTQKNKTVPVEKEINGKEPRIRNKKKEPTSRKALQINASSLSLF